MTKFCTNCGTELPSESKFCSKCGTMVKEEVVSVVQEPVSKEKKATGQLSQILKSKWPILVGVIGVLVVGFWLFNRNPLRGDWVSNEEEVEVSIKGNSVEMRMPDFSMGRSMTFKGPLKKAGKNEYLFPIKESSLIVTFHDAADSHENINDYLADIKDEINDLDLSAAERKVVNKTLDSIKKSGNDMILTMDISEYIKLLSADSKDFLDLDDFSTMNFLLRAKGSNQLLIGDAKAREDAIILDKK